MIALISTDPSFGNCVGIYRALSRRKETVHAFFRQKDRKGMYKLIPHKIGLKSIRMTYRRYIIVNASVFERMLRTHPEKMEARSRTIVVLTDAVYRRKTKYINEQLEGRKVLCMPDLSHMCTVPHRLFYQPYEHEGEIEKEEKLTIAHSPFVDYKMKQKGTWGIICAMHNIQQDHDVQFDMIHKNFWQTAIERRSRSHIFIDQVVDINGYMGGLGKSGIEAMAAGCLTLTSGEDVLGHIPPPPVVRVTPDNLEEKIRYYITHPAEREHMAALQKRWVETYLNYEYQSKYLLR